MARAVLTILTSTVLLQSDVNVRDRREAAILPRSSFRAVDMARQARKARDSAERESVNPH
jgi:hypothetical protein